MEGQKTENSVGKIVSAEVEEEVNFQNVRGYNLSCLLRHVLDWIAGASRYSNTELEQAAVQPWALSAILNCKVSQLPGHSKANVLYRDTVLAWSEVHKR